MSLLTLVILPFIGSVLAGLLPANARNREAWLAGLIALIGTIQVAMFYPDVSYGGIVRYEAEWLPTLGLNFSLRMDGLAWVFCLMVLAIGLLVVLYARYYMSPEDPVPRFFSFFLAFMGSMLGIVLSGNLIQLALFWELTSLVSFLLIGYWHHRADARRGARMALTVTAAGGLCLFAGILVLGHVVGSYDLDVVLASGDLIRSHPSYTAALALIAVGALTKSAQFPFHFWLPHAMAAPTPVSAYLHSATMVKAGVFILVRLWPVLAGTDEWFWVIGGAGLCTLLLGAYAAIFQQDLKGLLAYSTISHLGLITLLLGLGSPLATVAAIFHIMNHATFKASLFMAAGIIDHESGTRDIRKLSGLYRLMPVTATLAMVASAAMAGVPLLNGFISKEMFFTEAVVVGDAIGMKYALPIAATVAGAFSVAYSLRFMHDVFFGPPPKDLPRTPHEPPRWMRFPAELLAFACLLVGIIPSYTIAPFLATAARAVLGDDVPHYSLAIWHGFNLPLVMSFVALGGGALLYMTLQKTLRLSTVERLPLLYRLSGKRSFDRVMALSTAFAERLTGGPGTRGLQTQLLCIVLMALLVGTVALYGTGDVRGSVAPSAIDPVFALMWIIGIVCAVGAAYQAKYHRLAALTLLSGAGLVTCVTFAWLSAPDLALTQLAVEVVTTILILLGLRWLPRRKEPKELGIRTPMGAWFHRVRDFAIAVAAGGGMALLAYAMLTRPYPDSIAKFFLDNSLPGGGGGNVVNVLLVDFRGFDTLGEITVLGIVALTVYALLRRFRPAPESIALPHQQVDQGKRSPTAGPGHDAASAYLVVPGVMVRALLPVIAMFAIYLFNRGHNLPGGGFVAGLVMSVGLILQYMMGGTTWVEAHLKLNPQRWIGLGLLFAVMTGAGAWLFGYPFLTSHSAHPILPWVGEVPLPSAFLFDLGVFTLVVGATLLILTALAHQSIRSHRAIQHTAAAEGSR
ncbi:monovalent cation/H+ antiporter subunit A [Pigmentiphaga litoralis]|uniref:monovalent cation/H+ antiporter subunit A n=1 Tax=Pigmentiphaga litoralis TaxID=516702 RepID=UPI003B430CCD